MDSTKRAYLELHIAVFLFGFTAILGDLITLTALVLVWWRTLMTCLSIPFLVSLRKELSQLPKSLILKYMGIGVIVCLHWLCFFGAIKYSNASIGLICMTTASLFAAIIEPLVFRQKIKMAELGLGLMMIPGIILIVGNTEWNMYTGIAIGILSAFLAALFSTLNKVLVDDAPPLIITFLELGSGWLFLSFLLPFYLRQYPDLPFVPVGYDWLWLFILALGCTTLAYMLALRALKYLSAFTSNLTVNLEPVYGIIMAWFILDDGKELSTNFYIGCGLIVGAIFLNAWMNFSRTRKENS